MSLDWTPPHQHTGTSRCNEGWSLSGYELAKTSWASPKDIDTAGRRGNPSRLETDVAQCGGTWTPWRVVAADHSCLYVSWCGWWWWWWWWWVSWFVHNPPCKRSRTAAVYETYGEARDERTINHRKDAVWLGTVVRSDHNIIYFNSYIDDTFPDCGQAPHNGWSTGWLNARVYFKPELTFLNDMIFQ